MSATESPGWKVDPFGRHQHRYWDGSQWTEHVADDGKTTADPPIAHAEPPGQASGLQSARSTAPADDADADDEPVDENGPGSTAGRYVRACKEVMDAANATIESANAAVGARAMASDPSQHEIPRQNFAGFARSAEEEFVQLYKAFLQVRERAMEAAADFLVRANERTLIPNCSS